MSKYVWWRRLLYRWYLFLIFKIHSEIQHILGFFIFEIFQGIYVEMELVFHFGNFAMENLIVQITLMSFLVVSRLPCFVFLPTFASKYMTSYFWNLFLGSCQESSNSWHCYLSQECIPRSRLWWVSSTLCGFFLFFYLFHPRMASLVESKFWNPGKLFIFISFHNQFQIMMIWYFIQNERHFLLLSLLK